MRLPKLTLSRVVAVAICLAAAAGLVLSLATLLTIDGMPAAVMPQIVAPHRASLEEARIPTRIIDELMLGRALDAKSIALLSVSQRQAVIDFQQTFLALSNVFRHAAEASKTKAWSTLAISSVLMLVGILFWSFRKPPGMCSS
jgi:Na+(H+)/acetate symporter ActP